MDDWLLWIQSRPFCVEGMGAVDVVEFIEGMLEVEELIIGLAVLLGKAVHYL
jgi:hypothetical protein